MKDCLGCCASCGSNDLDYVGSEPVDNGIFYAYRCNRCEKTGKEWYNLKYVETTED